MSRAARPDTIAAPATPPGHGGIGVVRVSGPDAGTIGSRLAPPLPPARSACLRTFRDGDGAPIDHGLVLWLPGPGSYTGEDTLELQGHGGPAVLDAVFARVLELGARPARAGEFSERAFLNGRMDLAQAEAVADLIESSDRAGVRAAMRSLDGEFSRRVDDLLEQLTGLRAWVEATLDFPEEEIDFLADPELAARVERLRTSLAETRAAADNADRVLLVIDSASPERDLPRFAAGVPVDLIRNKIDLSGEPPGTETDAAGHAVFRVSATTGAGLDELRAHLHRTLGAGAHEGIFSARRRHLDALDRAAVEIEAAAAEFHHSAAGELVAERLLRAQNELATITGRVTSEDLLGEIFGRFCIGK